MKKGTKQREREAKGERQERNETGENRRVESKEACRRGVRKEEKAGSTDANKIFFATKKWLLLLLNI